jgi:hypothetical protein
VKDMHVDFLRVCAERIASGESKYGRVRADDRNRCREAREELYDAWNYLVPIMLVKHPRIKTTDEWSAAVTAVYRAYKAVCALEKVEAVYETRTPAREGAA